MCGGHFYRIFSPSSHFFPLSFSPFSCSLVATTVTNRQLMKPTLSHPIPFAYAVLSWNFLQLCTMKSHPCWALREKQISKESFFMFRCVGQWSQTMDNFSRVQSNPLKYWNSMRSRQNLHTLSWTSTSPNRFDWVVLKLAPIVVGRECPLRRVRLYHPGIFFGGWCQNSCCCSPHSSLPLCLSSSTPLLCHDVHSQLWPLLSISPPLPQS